MKRIAKRYEDGYYGIVAIPTSRRERKMMAIKYRHQNEYGELDIPKYSLKENSIITSAMILFFFNRSSCPIEKIILSKHDGMITDIELQYRYGEIDGDIDWINQNSMPSNEAFLMAGFLDRPRKLRQILQRYPEWIYPVQQYRKLDLDSITYVKEY